MTSVLNGKTTSSQADTSQKNSHKAVNEKAKNGVWQIVLLPVERIDPSPFQPRLSFDGEEMAELVASVRSRGVQQPIIVRTLKADQKGLGQDARHKEAGVKNGSNGQTKERPPLVRYHLIAGERRLRACKEVGRKTIPAIIRDDLTDAEAAELSLVENVQRSNLSIIEEAAGYKRLMIVFRMKEERIAKKVGKSVKSIRDAIKLLALPEAVQRLLANRSLSASHGQNLLPLAPFEQVCLLVAHKAAQEHLSALSLQATLLPNAREMVSKGLVKELDHRTHFNWREECGQCPHKAYLHSGYSSYCLKPGEWHKKQTAALELQKQEAARVLEEAREEGRTTVDTDKLPPRSYRDLSYRDLSYGTLPAGCTAQCPCRGEAAHPVDTTKKVPICLDPNRYSELVQAERQAHEQARERRFSALWSQAIEVLHEEWRQQEWRHLQQSSSSDQTTDSRLAAKRCHPTLNIETSHKSCVINSPFQVEALRLYGLIFAPACSCCFSCLSCAQRLFCPSEIRAFP